MHSRSTLPKLINLPTKPGFKWRKLRPWANTPAPKIICVLQTEAIRSLLFAERACFFFFFYNSLRFMRGGEGNKANGLTALSKDQLSSELRQMMGSQSAWPHNLFVYLLQTWFNFQLVSHKHKGWEAKQPNLKHTDIDNRPDNIS